jgi:hypothetical protein
MKKLSVLYLMTLFFEPDGLRDNPFSVPDARHDTFSIQITGTPLFANFQALHSEKYNKELKCNKKRTNRRGDMLY